MIIIFEMNDFLKRIMVQTLNLLADVHISGNPDTFFGPQSRNIIYMLSEGPPSWILAVLPIFKMLYLFGQNPFMAQKLNTYHFCHRIRVHLPFRRYGHHLIMIRTGDGSFREPGPTEVTITYSWSHILSYWKLNTSQSIHEWTHSNSWDGMWLCFDIQMWWGCGSSLPWLIGLQAYKN